MDEFGFSLVVSLKFGYNFHMLNRQTVGFEGVTVR